MRRSRPLRAARLLTVLGALLAGACATRVETLSAVLGPVAYPPAMVLATGARGEDCGRSVLFVALRQPQLSEAVARALATVPDATLLTDVEVETSTLATGVYNRTCVRVKGSAARLVLSLVVPAPAGHHGHHDANGP